jgi:hypothetical protein
MVTGTRMKTVSKAVLGLLALFSAGWMVGSTAFAGDHSGGQIRVMTQNLYDGTDRTGLLEATSFESFLAAVDFAYSNLIATRPNERLAAIAHAISTNKVDVVGLHEAAIWRTGASSLSGPPTPAENVQFDFLQMLLDEMGKLGQDYVAVAVLPGLDVQLPSTLGFDVRLTDRDAIIVRQSLFEDGYQVINLQEQDYLSQKIYTVALLNGAQVVERSGWASVDLARGKSTVRLVTTHLAFDPSFNPATAMAQASELLATAGRSGLPTVLLGDFNTNANSATDPTFPTYQTILNGGFKDAWNVARGNAAGLTCCQDENLANPLSKLSVRYDLIFVKGATVLDAQVVGDQVTDKTGSGLWPSDHAGVIATLQ